MNTYWKKAAGMMLSLSLSANFLSVFEMQAAEETGTKLQFEETEVPVSMQQEYTNAPVSQEETEEEIDPDATVRVSIVLKDPSAIEKGYSTEDIAENDSAQSYMEKLEKKQDTVIEKIEDEVLQGEELDVQWQLTLAANAISANVSYGQIEQIKEIAGVEDVILEASYEAETAETSSADTKMSSSLGMVGADTVYDTGYTGAGTRIAIIDTGIDTDHQSFDSGAYTYSLQQNAIAKDISYESYLESLNLLDEEEIASLLDQLNVSSKLEGVSASDLYLSGKLPFNFNYVDSDLDVTHDNDLQGGHGSHVAGITAANAYVLDDTGKYVSALEETGVQGVAPDAQILTLKVFGKNGGSYESDIVAAIEDAILLGADVINLSLGGSSPGNATSSYYQSVFDSLPNTDTEVVIAAGNSYAFAQFSDITNRTYASDVNFLTAGEPGTLTNALTVASVDSVAVSDTYFELDGEKITYTVGSTGSASTERLNSYAGDYEYVYLDSYGLEADYEGLQDLIKGKIVFVNRGESDFAEKIQLADQAGAFALVIVNTSDSSLLANASEYSGNVFLSSVTNTNGQKFKSAASAVDGHDNVYAGSLKIGTPDSNPEYLMMSEFSSWGTVGTLQLVPEITAPGGSILNVDGAQSETDQYTYMSGTSMATPHVAGLSALVKQYINENNLEETTGKSARFLLNSLLMSTSVPALQASSQSYWSVLKQGAGVADASKAVSASSYLMMDENATESYEDGKIKAELGDDPDRTGTWSYSFTINNFSEKTNLYSLSTDLFTQQLQTNDYGFAVLGYETAALAGAVTYTVDGKEYELTSSYDADVNKDGKTDSDDAQAILDSISGALSDDEAAKLDLAAADVDQDGNVTSYDAHLILSDLASGEFAIKAGASAKVTVTIQLSDATKAYLDESFENGAYLEGYTFVNSADGNDVQHSIPVLGFYGSWSDPSMFDEFTYADNLYGIDTQTYFAAEASSVLTYWTEDGEFKYVAGNPYTIEESYPADKAAIRSDALLSAYNVLFIRNAAAAGALVYDADGNLLYSPETASLEATPYYEPTSGMWYNTDYAKLYINKTAAELGLSENDTFTVTAAAVPEYYASASESISGEQLAKLISSEGMGKGVSISTTLTVDDTKPEMLEAVKNEDGSVTLKVKDNQYIAWMAVTSLNGISCYASQVPDQSAAGETVEWTIDGELLQEDAGSQVLVFAADYAGNEIAYTLTYGNEDPDYTGELIAAVSDQGIFDKAGFVKVEPDYLNYDEYTESQSGLSQIQLTSSSVTAAESVKGVLFYTTEDGLLYAVSNTKVASGNLADNARLVSSLRLQGIKEVYDMAWSESDQTLYVLSSFGEIYSVDLTDGTAGYLYTVETEEGDTLFNLAIDENGTFYSTTKGDLSVEMPNPAYLISWTNADARDCQDEFGNTLKKVTAQKKAESLNIENEIPGSMYYDRQSGKLLLAAGYNEYGSPEHALRAVNTETGSTALYSESLNSGFYSALRGLTRLEKYEGDAFDSKGVKAESLSLTAEDRTEFAGVTFSVQAAANPWYAEKTAVTWTSSNTAVASIDASGTVKTLTPGTTVITASLDGSSVAASFTLTVTEYPEGSAKVLAVKDSSLQSGSLNLSSASLEDFANTLEGSVDAAFYIGDQLYVMQNGQLGTVNEETGEFSALGGLNGSGITFASAAAAKSDESSDTFDMFLAPISNGQMLFYFNPKTNAYGGFDISGEISAPLAAITYVRSGTYNPIGYEDVPASYYFVMGTDGALYSLVMFSGYYELIPLGNTGINLGGCESVGTGMQAALFYNEDSGTLAVTKSTSKGVQLYYVNINTFSAADAGIIADSSTRIVTMVPDTKAENTKTENTKTAAGTLQSASVKTVKKNTPVLKNESAGSSWNGTVDTENLQASVDVNLKDSTNGVQTYTYDANVLTFENASFYADDSVLTPLYSVHNEVKDGIGTVTVAYAFSSAPAESTGKILFSFAKEEDLPSTVEAAIKEDGNSFYEPAKTQLVELAVQKSETPDDSGNDGNNGYEGPETPDDSNSTEDGTGNKPENGGNGGAEGSGSNGSSDNDTSNNGSSNNGNSNNGTTTNVDANGDKSVSKKEPVKTGTQIASDIWTYAAIAAVAIVAAVVLVFVKRKKDKEEK